MGYEYGEVYADTIRETLVPAVADELSPSFALDENSPAPVLTDGTFEIEFRRNTAASAASEHFADYRTIVEVATVDASENRGIVALIGQVVAAITTQGHTAVPVADFESELGSPPNPPTVTYYAKIDETHPRTEPRGLVRRRIVDAVAHEEAFTRNLRWEPTEYLRRYALGHNDIDHVEVTAQEADEFVRRMSRKLGQ